MKKVVSSVLILALVSTMLFSLGGCGKKVEEVPPTPEKPPVEDVAPVEAVSVSTDDIVNTLKVTYGSDYLPSQQLEKEVFEELTGITSDMYSEFYAEVSMDNTLVDTLFVVKAETEFIPDVEDALLAYREKQVNDTVQYPEGSPKLDSSSVLVYEDYVIFMALGADFVDEADVEAVIETATETSTVSETATETSTATETATEAVSETTTETVTEADFYALETKKGIEALDLLFEIGFNVEMPAEEVVTSDVDETTVTDSTEVVEDTEDTTVTEETTVTENADNTEVVKDTTSPDFE